MIPSRPRISVVMPVYNAGGTLQAAIESILEQTEERWELIVVDDGSDDGSADIIRRYARRDPRVRPRFEPHRGIVAALNAGLGHARAPYIARMDADDRSAPERLDRQLRYLEAHPGTGLVACRVQHQGDEKATAGYARYVRWINGLTGPRQISINRFIESPLAHPSVLFRRELVEQYGGYRPGPFPEDYELWLRWLHHGVRMAKVPQTLLQWHDTPGRLSRTGDRYSAEAFYRLKARYLARWLRAGNPHHPRVVTWGAGRTSRRRAALLEEHGIRITHHIDVDPHKIGQRIHGRPVWSPDDIPASGRHFIVSYVGLHGVNAEIQAHLESRGYRLGRHFIFAA